MTTHLKAAACQLPEIREDIGAAVSLLRTYSEKVASEGVDLVCFPECFLQGYLLNEEIARRFALELDSASFEAILEQLADIKPTIVFGLIEEHEGSLFNTAVVVEKGRLLGRYRKTHLHSGETLFKPGSSYPIFEILGFRFGINICYDTRFTESAASVADQGAELIVCLANNMLRREKAEAWKSLHNRIRAERAMEAGVWMISSDVTGERDNHIGLGPTSVINPYGSVVAQVPMMEVGMVIAEINLKTPLSRRRAA